MPRFGLEKTSLIDYPGKVACVLFARGCNLRCPYCHNPELVTGPEPAGMEDWEVIRRFLEKRKRVLQGVCITGGEPLLYPNVGEVIEEIHSLGLSVKLDTNGTIPEALETLEVDYVALDFKTSPGKYPILSNPQQAGSQGLGEKVLRSFQILKRRRLPHEVRITVAPEIFTREDAKELSTLLRGADQVILTNLRLQRVIDPSYQARVSPYPPPFLEEIKEIFSGSGIPCRVRRASGT